MCENRLQPGVFISRVSSECLHTDVFTFLRGDILICIRGRARRLWKWRVSSRVTLKKKKEEKTTTNSLTELLTWKGSSDTVVINISRRTLAVIFFFFPRSSWALVYLLAISCFPAQGSRSFPPLSFFFYKRQRSLWRRYNVFLSKKKVRRPV